MIELSHFNSHSTALKVLSNHNHSQKLSLPKGTIILYFHPILFVKLEAPKIQFTHHFSTYQKQIVMINTRIGTNEDIKGVLSLQEKYLFRNLTELERQKGFVTTPFTSSQIEEIIQQNGMFIAENEKDVIVAYAFAGSWDYFKQWEIFNVMISRFPKLTFHNIAITTENSFQYGPVCIDEDYRGKGLLHQIFEIMRIEFLKNYPIAITFINKINTISEKAHTKKLGWEIIDTFAFNTNNYIGLAFDMKKSVLK